MKTLTIPGAFPRPLGADRPTFTIANHPGDNRWYVLGLDGAWLRLPFPEGTKRDDAVRLAVEYIPGAPPVAVEAWKPGNRTGRPL